MAKKDKDAKKGGKNAKELKLEEKAAQEGVSDPAAGKGGGNTKLLVIVALGALLLGGGGMAGVFLFVLKDSAPAGEMAETEAASDEPEGIIQYIELDPEFIVNFPDRGRQRFLQAEVAIMGRDQEALDTINENLPMVRHHLNNLLSSQTIGQLQATGGVEALRGRATTEIQQILVDKIGRKGIDEVLFTSFVMQ